LAIVIDPPAGLVGAPGVVGVGIDVVDVARFGRALDRTPRFAGRVFTDTELAAGRSGSGDASLAARFAAKESVLKALGLGIFAVPLRDIEVTGGGDHAPTLVLHGVALAAAAERGIGRWMLSLSHDGAVAAAIAVGLR